QTGRTSGELLLTIINDILDFSKMESNQLTLEKTNFNLHDLLEQTVQLLSHQATIKNINIILSINPNLPTFVNGDPDRIRQILINLINNALKFTPKGTVTVIVSPKKETDASWVINFSVKDTGIGIPDDLSHSLFDKFTMADQSHSRSHEGTGLGLAICKNIVSLMKGDISYTSQINVGSTFDFFCEFGRANEIPNDTSSLQHSDDFSIDKNIRILLVEDNPANQFVIKQILNHEGLNVELASNGKEALDILTIHPYDVILMDISMPIMDGITTTQKIRQSNSVYSDIPIIALTAHALSGDREKYLHAGMNDYLQKPINKNATLRCINKWTQSINNAHPILLERHQKNDTYVDYATIKRLVNKTSESHAFELITLYISDTHQRLALMGIAQKSLDLSVFSKELEIIFHSSITHGNTALHAQAKKFLDLHKSNKLGSLYLANVEFQQIAEVSLSKLSDAILDRYNQAKNNKLIVNN
ncbi:MAG: response regulator, partial [Pseudomonadales bacterium]|nr:response regulator [Pseudomonadales bacterium]